MEVLNGRWGAYIKYKSKNYKIPKDTVAKDLTYDDCLKIVESQPASKSRKGKATTKRKTKK